MRFHRSLADDEQVGDLAVGVVLCNEQGHLSLALVIFIGVSEVAGGLGVLLPALTRVRPALTPLAAVGLAAILVLAICFHLIRGEASHTPIPLAFLALAVFVAWGRSVKAPISPRTPPSP